MAAEVLHHYYHSGNGAGDAWSVDRKRPSSPSSSNDQLHFRTTSPIIGVKETSTKRLDRPKSVPPNLIRSKSAQEYRTKPRPKTAAVYGCERVNQVEREPTRKHNLDTHLPQRKPRSPPWQKQLDYAVLNPAYGPYTNAKMQPMPVMITPGYTMTKSKSKIEMHIKTDEFFEPVPENTVLRREDPERDSLISQLQQQIDDLTLFLEEERLNHRESKRRAADQLRDRLDDLGHQHENSTRQLQQKHEEDTEALKNKYEDLITQNHERSTAQIGKMKKEIEYLQSAFESYKSQLHFETDERWKTKEDELRAKCEEDMDKKVAQLRHKIQAEKSAERAHFEREQKYELQNLKREQKRELDSLTRRFSNHQADIEKLAEAEQEIESLQKHCMGLQEEYDSVCSKVTDITTDLTDTKVKLLGYEQNFEEKCQAIDEKYKSQIQELKQANIELRRLYVKKCGQLFDEKSISERTIQDQVESAKDTMKYIIETRNRALVSVAAGDPDLDKRYGQRQKQRPVSAPGTKTESVNARVSAGGTDTYLQQNRERRRPNTAKPRILQQIEQEIEDGTLVVERSEVPDNVEDILLQAL